MSKLASDKIVFYDVASLRQIPTTQWLIDGVVPHNAINIIYGMPGCGKTFVALDLALHLSNSDKWREYNINIKKNMVIYFAGEGVNCLAKRIEAWSKHNKINPLNFYVVPIENVDVMDDDSLTDLITQLRGLIKKEKNNISMMVFDTVARTAINLDENSTRDMGFFIHRINKLKNIFDTTILLVHHSGKNAKSGMRGSSVLLGNVDAVFEITNEDFELTIECVKQKDGPEISIGVQLIEYCGSLVLAKPKSALWDKEQDAILCMSLEQNENIDEICKKLTRKPQEIIGRVKRLAEKQNLECVTDIVASFKISNQEIASKLLKYFPLVKQDSLQS